MVEQGERVRHQDGHAHTLDRSRSDERAKRGCQCARERRQTEQSEASQEHPFGPHAITQCACHEDERCKADRVGADHPLESSHCFAVRGTDAGESHVDDRDVELDDAEPEAHRRQGGPLRRARTGAYARASHSHERVIAHLTLDSATVIYGHLSRSSRRTAIKVHSHVARRRSPCVQAVQDTRHATHI